MSWKDVPKYIYDITKFAYSIPKDSYKIEVDKFHIPPSSHPLTIPYQGPKVRYSEGDEINTVEDFRFDLDFTRIPLGPDHFPCGYWHKNYIPPFTIIYTSRLYPIEFQDSFNTITTYIVDGNFRDIYNRYDNYTESFKGVTNSLVYGTFDIKNFKYIYSENFNHSIISLLNGVFKKSLWQYEYAEVFNHVNITIYSGNFRDALIKYSWPVEEFTHTSITLISGTHT